MSIKQVHDFLIGLPNTKLDFPFGEDVAVFKVMGKMFGLLSDNSVSLKCEPMLAQLLREKYKAVTPGYHLNKRHWNSIKLDGSVPQDELFELIDHSYELVVKKLRKADREKLAAQAGK